MSYQKADYKSFSYKKAIWKIDSVIVFAINVSIISRLQEFCLLGHR